MFSAKEDAITHTEDIIAPTMVTALQPHRFTKELDIGPEKKESIKLRIDMILTFKSFKLCLIEIVI